MKQAGDHSAGLEEQSTNDWTAETVLLDLADHFGDYAGSNGLGASGPRMMGYLMMTKHTRLPFEINAKYRSVHSAGMAQDTFIFHMKENEYWEQVVGLNLESRSDAFARTHAWLLCTSDFTFAYARVIVLGMLQLVTQVKPT